MRLPTNIEIVRKTFILTVLLIMQVVVACSKCNILYYKKYTAFLAITFAENCVDCKFI